MGPIDLGKIEVMFANCDSFDDELGYIRTNFNDCDRPQGNDLVDGFYVADEWKREFARKSGILMMMDEDEDDDGTRKRTRASGSIQCSRDRGSFSPAFTP